MTRVAILWHMHQPYYQDLVTREHILPWVRLHALKDYFGMVALLREFPDVRLTFNLVPSLLVQLEAFAADRAHDRYLDIGTKPAEALTPDEASFMDRNFFHAHPDRMIAVYPRYAQLLAMRGRAPGGTPAYSRQELRDLQVWQKLAWIDPLFLDRDPRVRALIDKGRQFSEDDKAVLRTVELELLNAVIPEYRDAARRGQIELSTSPFYHPILPLLCDTNVYREQHPASAMPRRRFAHPEDALEQLTRAVQYHELLFGAKPAGVWPSEGSVSNAMVPLVARAGFSWMATDEQILARTLGVAFTRDAAGYLDQPEQLYRPYEISVAGARTAAMFRDHTLSDLIGFVYANWNADAAADDFVGRLVEAGRRYARQRRSGDPAEPVIPIVLDGENAWEHFEGGGRPFLRALYARLSRHPELRTVTMGEACGDATASLNGVAAGSWIDADFYIWIGHADDHRAWSQLADARDALGEALGANAPAAPDAQAVARAHEELLIAEGSDWFWWYGDDHSSEHDAEFDDLFRRHLRNVYGLLQRPVPDDLYVTNISVGSRPDEAVPPTGFLRPVIDGVNTSYFEWLSAGVLDVRRVSGTMHAVERQGPVLARIAFGCDRERLYARLDGREPAADLLAKGFEFSLKFTEPAGVRISSRLASDGRVAVSRWEHIGSPPQWAERGPGGAAVGARLILEVGVPLAELGVTSKGPDAGGDDRDDDGRGRLGFFVAVYDGNGVEIERHGPIELPVPGPRFVAANWSA
jgi:alpha-amylase/alpha-mannosidase (GH57 family)